MYYYGVFDCIISIASKLQRFYSDCCTNDVSSPFLPSAALSLERLMPKRTRKALFIVHHIGRNVWLLEQNEQKQL
jgi:hypothetical protein